MIWIFLLIYFVSFVIHIIAYYIINKRFIFRVGDLIDSIEFYMWFPIVNTIAILVAIILFIVFVIWELMKLNVIWDKFRNIKLK